MEIISEHNSMLLVLFKLLMLTIVKFYTENVSDFLVFVSCLVLMCVMLKGCINEPFF